MDDHYYDLTLDSGGTIIARAAHEKNEEKKSVALNDSDLELLKMSLNLVNSKSTNPEHLKSLGKLLFRILIGGTLTAHFVIAINNALSNRLQLRLNLDQRHRFGDFRAAALPWEILYHEPFGFLATNSQFTLSRYIGLNESTERPLDNLPLRVLFVGAKPEDLKFIFADPAIESVKEQLEGQISKDQIHIEPLEHPNRKSLIDKIKEFKPHVLHFMGHGKFEELEGGAIALVNPKNKKAIWISEAETDALFKEWKPKVVVLVACEGAKESLQAKVPSLAQAIVKKNIEVVGMRFKLTNKTGMAFTRAFYQSLADGEPLDVATQAARSAIYENDVAGTKRDFGGVVLYMRSAQGIIFPSNKPTPSDDRRPTAPPHR